VALLALTACLPRTVAQPVAPPTAASEWPATYAQALYDAREERFANADRVLTDFAQRFPGSREAAEVPYWRALYKLDPNSQNATRDATVLLDAYLANTPTGLHRVEATTLRKLVSALDARTAALAPQPAVPLVKPEDKAKDDELLRLRDDLAKANAELARIKRRLARPAP
jgi:hypothetical protein